MSRTFDELKGPVVERLRARIAELETELQNPSGGWYCTDCGSADALVSITYRLAELEALLRRARWRISEDVFQDFTDEIDAALGDK